MFRRIGFRPSRFESAQVLREALAENTGQRQQTGSQQSEAGRFGSCGCSGNVQSEIVCVRIRESGVVLEVEGPKRERRVGDAAGEESGTDLSKQVSAATGENREAARIRGVVKGNAVAGLRDSVHGHSDVERTSYVRSTAGRVVGQRGWRRKFEGNCICTVGKGEKVVGMGRGNSQAQRSRSDKVP